MNKRELDELWSQVKHVGEVERLEYDAMIVLGSVFGQMQKVILEQQERIDKVTQNIGKEPSVHWVVRTLRGEEGY
ncbi:hypothetical protein [Alkalihalobacillus sp. BA299]|uniref:hypothetical protein n=1 Tax=Alkalihalobacillus sp. BA299 TaxID=2815938 RepID=UPI001AD977AA|nr:hypothetical protein [Alkalihalobacillus sp. BA299]